MNQLLQKLEDLEELCLDDRTKKEREMEEKKLDDFDKLKNKISKEVRKARKEIQERDALLKKHQDDGPETVRMSAQIREHCKNIRQDCQKLNQIQTKTEEKMKKVADKGKEIPSEVLEDVRTRREIVDLCFKHYEEVKYLESPSTDIDFVGAIGTNKDNVPSSLPDIDDPKFQILIQQDLLLDEKIKLVGEGVKDLKQIALAQGREAEKQRDLIDDVEIGVDRANEHLNQLNVQLKKTLDKVRKPSRFILDFIMVILVLGIGLYIYNLATG